MTLQSSQRLPELLFYTKKSYKILQLQFQLQYYTCTLHCNPENSPSRIQFYMQKTKSSSSTTVQFPENSTHRRQGDLLEIHPCVLQDIPGNSSCSRDIQDIPVIHDLPAFPGNSTNVPVSPGNPPNSSILRLECIFYSSIGFHRKLHRVPVGPLQTLQTFILQRKGDVAISVKLTDYSK